MSAPIRVAIRADAGRQLGTGHYARASAVAQALSAAGGTEVLLVTGEEGAPLVPAYFQVDVPVITLPPGNDDAAEAMQALRQKGWAPDVIYLDHYDGVAEWEKAAAQTGAGLVVLDDLDAARSADVIVRPHGGPAGEANGVVLRGPAFLPLSRHVASLAAQARPVRSPPLKLNVCFGGSDPTGETAKALKALANLETIQADVVIGPGAEIDPTLIEAAEQMPHVTLHRAPSQEQLSGLMASADMALGAGGVMLWERLCIGVPSLVVCVAENQRPQIEEMSAAGAIRFIGDHSEVTADAIVRAVCGLADEDSSRDALSSAGRALVDGKGAFRLAAWIRALAVDPRDVQQSDAQDILDWRTDERNWRHNWEEADKPDFAAHSAWLGNRLADQDCLFRILMLHGEPVGVVRFDLQDGGISAYLSIYLVPAWHGRKMGLPVFLAAERSLRRSHPQVREIVSRIHRDNKASERLHRDAGFQVELSKDRADWLDARKALD